MIIRQAIPQDADAICVLQNAIIRDSLITFTTVEKTPEDVAGVIAGGAPYLVAVDQAALLGFASWGTFRAGPGYAHTAEHSIYLTESAQGRGVARALLAALEDEATKAGIHVLVAGISGVNQGAIRFHERMGYAEVGRLPETGRKAGRWLDLVLMQKILRVQTGTGPDTADFTG
jgi:phosphinothricin acetyltransferase